MPTSTLATKNSQSEDARFADRSTRLLLALWELSVASTDIKKGNVTQKVVRKGEKSGDYQSLLDDLVSKGAIAIPKRNVITVSASQIRDLLIAALQGTSFEFKAQIGKNTANALLKLLREKGTSESSSPNGKVATISSYEEFKPIALSTFDLLNKDYNMGNMVPIYRIRREVGDRISRAQFNEWLFEMQSENFFELLEESVEDGAPDKIEDSVTTKLGKLRCYAKR